VTEYRPARSNSDRNRTGGDRTQSDRGGDRFSRNGRSFDKSRSYDRGRFTDRPDKFGDRPRSRDNRRDNIKRAEVEISLGQKNRIQPGFVLGAFTEATGLEGKSFGKINIRENYTTIEVPEKDLDHVIKKLTGTKIAGQPITITKR
jgi:hypothetical protein